MDEFTHLSAQPASLVGGQLKKYQLTGLNWLISLYELGINGILADEMGLGKTIQTIAFLAYLAEFRQVRGPHLVICPNTVLLNWLKEFKKWLPSLRVVKLFARKEARLETLRDHIRTREFDVLLTTYEGINVCKTELKRIDWSYLIVDEAHRLKNEASLLSRNLREFRPELKILLTGTPLQNNLKELWALLNFLMPELFDDAEIFELAKPGEAEVSAEERERQHVALIQSMHKILRPFILRRSKDSVELKLPPKSEIHLYVGLTELQLSMYKSILVKKPLTEDSGAARNILMQLRKCCNHPFLFPPVAEEAEASGEPDLVAASGKMIVLDKLLQRLRRAGQRQVLIFSQFTSMLSIIEEYLLAREWAYCRIDGATFIEERERQIEEFVRAGSEKFVFLLSTRAGGLGINLASADTVVIFDSDWNPQMDLQAMDRAHRIGQSREVRIYRLIAESTVEEKMVERQKIKMKWDSLVVLKGRAHSRQVLSKKELAGLLNFGASRIFRSETGTYRDEDIDDLLEQGARRTAELQSRIDEAFKPANAALNLNIESINIYEFAGDDYHRRKADEDALRHAVESDFHAKKLKKRMLVAQPAASPPSEPVRLPEHHFYADRRRLEELLGREHKLSEPEREELRRLSASGFADWTKTDLNALVRAVEKWGEKDLPRIAKALRRGEEETRRYMDTLFSRIGELPDHQRILRNMDRAEKARANRLSKEKTLRKKCAAVQCFEELSFETLFYNKVKSKLFTQWHDKFLVYQAFKLGVANVKEIRQAFVSEPLFRFDFYAKSLRESTLTKRISSLLRMLQNEDANEQAERPRGREKAKARPKSSSSFKSPQRGSATKVAKRKLSKKIAKRRSPGKEAPASPGGQAPAKIPTPRKNLRKTKAVRRKKVESDVKISVQSSALKTALP